MSFISKSLTRQIDGSLARNFNAKSVLGTILDPAADKLLMTTLAVTLAWNGALPSASLVRFVCKLESRSSRLGLRPRKLTCRQCPWPFSSSDAT